MYRVVDMRGIARMLRARRKSRNLRMVDLAEKSGLSTITIENCEKTQRYAAGHTPKLQTFLTLLHALDLKVLFVDRKTGRVINGKYGIDDEIEVEEQQEDDDPYYY